MKSLLSYCAVCLCVLLVAVNAASAADHREAPALLDSANVGGQDLNDIYLFRSPSNKKNTVLIMTVNPFAGVLSPTTLDTSVFYELVIDNDGDAKEDIVFRFQYIDVDSFGTQFVIVTRVDRNSLLGQAGMGRFYAVGFTNMTLKTLDGGKTRTGLYDDPFFFDIAGFNKLISGMGTFDGTDGFAAANVSAIVLEVPSASLLRNVKKPSKNIGVWARTVSQGTLGMGFDSQQIDRTGRPAIATALIPPGATRDLFNFGQPRNDQRDFRHLVIGRLDFIWGLVEPGNPHPAGGALADALLPDILTFNTGRGAGFLNGRRLADDVIDAELSLLTSPAPFVVPGAVTTDGVDANDKPFREKFPYLAPPHPIAVP